MTKQEIKAERLAIQRLIRASNKKLLSQIKRNHKGLVRLIRSKLQVYDGELLDLYFYHGIEWEL